MPPAKSETRLNYQSNLKFFLNPIFEELDKQKVAYCVCGNYHDLPEFTSHDVDVWTENIGEVEKIILSVANNTGFVLYLYNRTANGSNNRFYKVAVDNSIEFVRIDLLQECAWSSFIPLVEAKNILQGRVEYKNFFIAEPIVETCMHLLYPLIQYGKIKEKYKEKICKYYKEPGFYNILSESLGGKTARHIINRIGDKDWDSIERENIKYKIILIFRYILHLNLKRLKIFFKFTKTNIYRLLKPSGLFIAFIGTDGAGKTTIINRLDKFFTQNFMSGKVEQFYWRPYLFPPLKNLAPFTKTTDNDEGNSQEGPAAKQGNAIFSYVKFFYYFFDYIVGRKKYQSVWSRGGIVCFDRYYYDHIIYPQRFSFSVPRRLMSFMEKFIPQPDLIFFLYAPPEILNQRKMEHPFAEVVRQAKEYDDLISKLSNAHKINTTYSIEEVEKKIIRTCVEYMAGRLVQR